MKRSELNAILRDAIDFTRRMGFALPPFATWTLDDWQARGAECDEIIDNMLGWDITDFGSGDFERVGLLICTLRNGNFTDPRYDKPYCEKILIQNENQVLPSHYHWRKMEDIINRGGGDLMVELCSSTPDGGFGDAPVTVTVDGRAVTVASREALRLRPGESITLRPGQFHKFWGSGGRLLLGEVSTVNDDRVDNYFPGFDLRFADIEEDTRPEQLRFNDYALLRQPDQWPAAWRA